MPTPENPIPTPVSVRGGDALGASGPRRSHPGGGYRRDARTQPDEF